VCVRVDEAGRYDEAGGVDGPCRASVRSGRPADEHDPVARDADVGEACGSAGAVEELAVTDEKVELRGGRAAGGGRRLGGYFRDR
jgi:hypothetical protein